MLLIDFYISIMINYKQFKLIQKDYQKNINDIA